MYSRVTPPTTTLIDTNAIDEVYIVMSDLQAVTNVSAVLPPSNKRFRQIKTPCLFLANRVFIHRI